jgi:hypothetical protein
MKKLEEKIVSSLHNLDHLEISQELFTRYFNMNYELHEKLEENHHTNFFFTNYK